MWEAGRRQTFISVFHLSFCTKPSYHQVNSNSWRPHVYTVEPYSIGFSRLGPFESKLPGLSSRVPLDGFEPPIFRLVVECPTVCAIQELQRLFYKAGKLPPDLWLMFKSSPTKKILFFWPGHLPQTQKHGAPDPAIWSTPASLGWGNCVCPVSSQTLSCSLFFPFLTPICRHRHSLVGTCSSISSVYKTLHVPSVYLLAALD